MFTGGPHHHCHPPTNPRSLSGVKNAVMSRCLMDSREFDSKNSLPPWWKAMIVNLFISFFIYFYDACRPRSSAGGWQRFAFRSRSPSNGGSVFATASLIIHISRSLPPGVFNRDPLLSKPSRLKEACFKASLFSRNNTFFTSFLTLLDFRSPHYFLLSKSNLATFGKKPIKWF